MSATFPNTSRVEYTGSDIWETYKIEATGHIMYCSTSIAYISASVCEYDLDTLRRIKDHHFWTALADEVKAHHITAMANTVETSARFRLAALKTQVPELMAESFEKTVELSRQKAAGVSESVIDVNGQPNRQYVLEWRLDHINGLIDQHWRGLREREDELKAIHKKLL